MNQPRTIRRRYVDASNPHEPEVLWIELEPVLDLLERWFAQRPVRIDPERQRLDDDTEVFLRSHGRLREQPQ